ncbi:MBL fold metallo-hydrolase [Chitinophagaceae bacterium LB-8]|uniref:MBL fold metallo-hydrolase n=1 Tax=Paraflavisolibacter caeni TaxID=2982496 RepID=A0A9X2XTY2_9BACT|nr:MBL fold metallo-hydrolase [Paraflavisolibacter caeni]MCU7548356.1 MBL fold metallo-hydrolase [Paraflavisolibacter caeni]
MKNRERILQSANFKGGAFQNLSKTSVLAKGVTYFKMIKDSLNKPEDVKPPVALPSVKTDLKSIQSEKPVIIWFGHSSYFIHMNGINILVDPVFSGFASPFSFMIKAFPGSDVYTADDLPAIDILILTHNHYDHLDVKTISNIRNKVKSCYVPLGVGEKLERLGLNDRLITELDWWESEDVRNGIELTATPARHFSGRGFRRGGSLWTSYVLKIFGYNLYLGGDSGYDSHFKEIGDKFDSFDLAILECGQYNANWPQIHMMPEEAVQACIDLRAAMLFPVHWGKFALSTHSWNEPIIRVAKAALEKKVAFTTPMIGEPIIINEHYPHATWWNL